MIVVTGAAGFIGSNVVAALNAEGRDDIVAVDISGVAEHTGNLDGLEVQARVERDGLFNWLESHGGEVDGIVHLGACSDTTVTDREYVMKNNVEYTRKLWEFCAWFEKRFVYASSAATYGDGSKGYDDRADPRKLTPLNLYGESKQRFDLWALEQGHGPQVWAGLKFFNVYGPREQHKGRMASMAYHSFNQIKATGKVRLFKSDRPGIPDGGQKRDFIHVSDAVATILHFLRIKDPKKANSVFNVGTGVAREFAELALAVFNGMEREPVVEFIPMADDLKGKYQYFTQADTTKLRASGLTKPFLSLEDGVRSYVKDWLLKKV